VQRHTLYTAVNKFTKSIDGFQRCAADGLHNFLDFIFSVQRKCVVTQIRDFFHHSCSASAYLRVYPFGSPSGTCICIMHFILALNIGRYLYIVRQTITQSVEKFDLILLSHFSVFIVGVIIGFRSYRYYL